jgi:phosphohistidine phosphatase
MTRHRLLLLRHTKSSWDDPAPADHDRPLAARGRRAAKAIRQHVQDAGIAPQLVLCSSAVRAVQTWEAVRDGIDGDPEVEISDDLYEAGADDLLDRLRGVPETVESVLMVGHNPSMEELAGELSGPGDPEALTAMTLKYPTGGLATLSFDRPWAELAPGAAHLDSFVVPRDLV